MLRVSFHHERLSSSCKGNNEFTKVNAPSLSIALSGIPYPVRGLIATSEDGLFSRFIFYAFKVEQKWKDVSLNANNINLPRRSDATQFKTGDSKRKFFDALPAEFTRQQAVETGKQFQLSPRTVDDILHNATDKALEKLKAWLYQPRSKVK